MTVLKATYQLTHAQKVYLELFSEYGDFVRTNVFIGSEKTPPVNRLELIRSLAKKGWLEKGKKAGYYRITEKGKQVLRDGFHECSIKYTN